MALPKLAMQQEPSLFGELDDPEWITLYPEQDESRDLLQRGGNIPAKFSSGGGEMVVVAPPSCSAGAGGERRILKRLGKRKSSSVVVSDESEDFIVRKHHDSLRQRKKVFVGDLERKLGSMTTAIEELNSAINLIGGGGDKKFKVVRNSYLLHQGAAPPPPPPPPPPPSFFASSPLPGGASGAKTIRSKRSKLPKRDHSKGFGFREARRMIKRPASALLLVFLCLVMLFFPIKVGIQGLGSSQSFGGSSPATQRWSMMSSRDHERWPSTYASRIHGMEIPRFTRGGVEGSSIPGRGTSVGSEKKDEGSSASSPSSKVNDSTNTAKVAATGEDAPFMQQWDNSVFTAGKCTQVFQFRSSSEGNVAGSRVIRKKQLNDRPGPGIQLTKNKVAPPPPMVVSVLPKKSMSGPTGGEVFVVVAIDGVKYVTYSCSLPQQIMAAGP
ncbi:hypothetical protein SELMODRAFT_409591 [Selaginella moellendorffii]|uniref:Uncharacterized protein n=1 Tax=Selaginella moellendorffii TaxID=88036 RepID=D8RBY0_SELML|nr:hypothetical protein SELMODRAFT_409591 [Selaginella moellendorffii]